jgi:fucose permease
MGWLVQEQIALQDLPPPRAALLRWPVALAFAAFILIGASDGAVGVLLPSIRAHYDVDKATISLLFLAGAAGYLTAAFNSGPLAGKLGRRAFLMLAAASFLLGATTMSLTPPFVIVLFAVLAIGFGAGCIDAGLNAYIASLPDNTAKLNYLHAFYGAGAWLGPVVASGLLAAQSGWNSVYLVWVALSLTVLIGFSLAFRGQQPAIQPTAARDGRGVLMVALRLRVVWLGAFFLFFYVGTEVSLGSWSYSFLTEARHGSTLLSGWAVSGYWLGLMLGRVTLANLARRVGNKRLIQGCLAGVLLGVSLIWLAPDEAISAFGLGLTGFSLGPIFPTTIALMSGLVEARLLPSAIGFLASLGSMGAAFFPWLAGNLAQWVGLWSLLPYSMLLTCVMLGFWLALQARPRPRAEVAA